MQYEYDQRSLRFSVEGRDLRFIGSGANKDVFVDSSGDFVYKVSHDLGVIDEDVRHLALAESMGIPTAMPVEVHMNGPYFFTQKYLAKPDDLDRDVYKAWNRTVKGIRSALTDFKLANLGFCLDTKKLLVHDLNSWPHCDDYVPLFRRHNGKWELPYWLYFDGKKPW